MKQLSIAPGTDGFPALHSIVGVAPGLAYRSALRQVHRNPGIYLALSGAVLPLLCTLGLHGISPLWGLPLAFCGGLVTRWSRAA